MARAADRAHPAGRGLASARTRVGRQNSGRTGAEAGGADGVALEAGAVQETSGGGCIRSARSRSDRRPSRYGGAPEAVPCTFTGERCRKGDEEATKDGGGAGPAAKEAPRPDSLPGRGSPLPEYLRSQFEPSLE
jgi:hypothetical protein